MRNQENEYRKKKEFVDRKMEEYYRCTELMRKERLALGFCVHNTNSKATAAIALMDYNLGRCDERLEYILRQSYNPGVRTDWYVGKFPKSSYYRLRAEAIESLYEFFHGSAVY